MFWLTIASFIIFLAMMITAIVNLRQKKEIQSAKAVSNTCVSYSLLILFMYLFKVYVPYWTILLSMSAALISGFWGQYLRMYYRSIRFDRYLHAYGSFSFALLFFYLMDQFLRMGGSSLFLAVFVFLLGNTLGVIFELLEFIHDLKPANTSKSQHGLKDTNTDMLFNLFGAMFAALLIYFTV